MKAKHYSIALLFSFTMLACNLYAQTTLEEYNYLTKGYKVQIESGLDMKKGYELKELDTKSTNERTATLMVLYRVKQTKKEIAAYLIIYNKLGNPKEYICIPSVKSEKEILINYVRQLYDGSSNVSERLALILILLTQQLVW